MRQTPARLVLGTGRCAHAAERAGKVARAMSKCLNQMVRDYMEQLSRQDEASEAAAELRRLSAESNGDSRGWRFDREALHDRP